MDMPSPYYASLQKSPVLPGLSLFILFLVLQCKVLIQIAFQHTVIQLALFIGSTAEVLLEILCRGYIIVCRLAGRPEHVAHRLIKLLHILTGHQAFAVWRISYYQRFFIRQCEIFNIHLFQLDQARNAGPSCVSFGNIQRLTADIAAKSDKFYILTNLFYRLFPTGLPYTGGQAAPFFGSKSSVDSRSYL